MMIYMFLGYPSLTGKLHFFITQEANMENQDFHRGIFNIFMVQGYVQYPSGYWVKHVVALTASYKWESAGLGCVVGTS